MLSQYNSRIDAVSPVCSVNTAMSKLILVIGIVQIIAGVVILGMVAKDFSDTAKKNDILVPMPDKINAFGPVLIALLVIVNGVFGVLTMCCDGNAKMQVFYLMGACIAAAASASMVWIYAINVYKCQKKNAFGFKVCVYDKENQNIHITLLVFSLLACAMSVLGMVTSSLTACRKIA